MAGPGTPSRFDHPTSACDLVLKGGITSGVVYPLALVSLAEQYRFSSIGGTSAGAIAAAAAAAAEYGRNTKGAGFERVEKIPDEVGQNLLALFQPSPLLKPVFDIFVAALKAKSTIGRVAAIFFATLKGYWGSASLGLAAGLAVAIITWHFAQASGGVAFALLLLLSAVTGLAVAIGWRLVKAANSDLVGNDFGLCPGIRQAYSPGEGFTDWLARLIDEAAGRPGDTDKPLTFGDLAAPPEGRPPIHLAMMTTSLMEQRPYTLPMKNRRFLFEKGEWSKLFPERIIAYLVGVCEPFVPPAGEKGEYYYFPDETRLPLIVAARMSLSFPVLICAVPLWCRDFKFQSDLEKNKLRRCLFSDGGLSSNFPIHFFDHLLPNSPTFAITLDEYDAKRNRDNVWLPATAGSGAELPVQPFDGLVGFLMRLVDAAKNWQDNLQSTLPGYRERIAHIALDPKEGGLNLAMDAATIGKLVGYGKQAGELLRDEFDFEEHRWRRFLVAMARMEQTLDEIALAYDGVAGGPPNFDAFLNAYPQLAKEFKQSSAVLAEMLKRGKELSSLGSAWRAAPTVQSGHIPKPDTHLRISPKP